MLTELSLSLSPVPAVVRGPRPGSGAENAGSSAWTLQRIGLLLVGAAWMTFALVVALQ
jgi:hypothetical protein